MITFHIFFIAIIQGITEFLPISSSAHLIILPYLMKVSDQGVIIDISAHLGSLLALMVFFKKDSTNLFRGLIQFFFFKNRKKECYLFLKIGVATIPVIFFGLIFNSSSVCTKLLEFELLLKITGSFDGMTPYRQTYFSNEAPSIIPGRSLF